MCNHKWYTSTQWQQDKHVYQTEAHLVKPSLTSKDMHSKQSVACIVYTVTLSK